MLQTTSPRTHQSLGRKVKGYDEGVWDRSMLSSTAIHLSLFTGVSLSVYVKVTVADELQHKLRIVEQGNYHKFACSNGITLLKAKLLQTGQREIVEVFLPSSILSNLLSFLSSLLPFILPLATSFFSPFPPPTTRISKDNRTNKRQEKKKSLI